MATVALQPYALTLFTFAQMLDHERIMRVIERAERLDAAAMIATGVNAPKELARYQQELRNDAADRPAVTQSSADILARAHRLAERMLAAQHVTTMEA